MEIKVRFKTGEKSPYSFDLAAMGYIWTNRSQHAFYRNQAYQRKKSIRKTLSYLFFDVKKLMVSYQQNLKTKDKEQK